MSKPKKLRGGALIEAALRQLADIESWKPINGGLSWSRLAERLGVSRTAVANKPAIQDAYVATRKALADGTANYFTPEQIVRRHHQEQIADLQKRIAELERQRDGWIELWATVEYNAREFGYDANRLFRPLTKPDR